MNCRICNREIPQASHFHPIKHTGVNQDGLPDDWYSHPLNSAIPQTGGHCPICFDGSYMKIKNGDIYRFGVENNIYAWRLFQKAVNHRPNKKPIGGYWIQ